MDTQNQKRAKSRTFIVYAVVPRLGDCYREMVQKVLVASTNIFQPWDFGWTLMVLRSRLMQLVKFMVKTPVALKLKANLV